MRLAIGLVMTVVALAVVGRRVHYLYRLVSSGQPAPGRLDGIGTRAKDQLREVFGQRKLLQWSVPGVAHFFTFWAFVVLAATILEAYGALFDRDFAIPVIGHWPLLGFLQDFFAVAVLLVLGVFAVIRIRNAPARRRARVPVLRLAHRRRLARAVHDLQRHLDAVPLPRRAGQHRRLPVRRGGVRLAGGRRPARAAGRGHQRGAGDDRDPAADRRGARLPGDRRLLQAPAHLPRAAQRAVQARAQRARPAAADHGRRQAGRLRGPRRARRGHGLRPRQDRGLHLEGLARLRDLHRVRPLPVPVPGLEHRQAAVAQAADHGPARPPLREGARTSWRPPTRRRRGGPTPARRRAGAAGRPAAGRTRRAASSTPTCSGRAPPAAPASSSARSTSSTSTTSSTCAATRCWSSRRSRPRRA